MSRLSGSEKALRQTRPAADGEELRRPRKYRGDAPVELVEERMESARNYWLATVRRLNQLRRGESLG